MKSKSTTSVEYFNVLHNFVQQITLLKALKHTGKLRFSDNPLPLHYQHCHELPSLLNIIQSNQF
jgi:hypothetical protein